MHAPVSLGLTGKPHLLIKGGRWARLAYHHAAICLHLPLSASGPESSHRHCLSPHRPLLPSAYYLSTPLHSLPPLHLPRAPPSLPAPISTCIPFRASCTLPSTSLSLSLTSRISFFPRDLFFLRSPSVYWCLRKQNYHLILPDSPL